MADYSGLEEIDKEKFNVPIRDLGLPKLISIEQDKTLEEVYKILDDNKFGAIVLTEGGVLSGILTERDFLLKVWGHFDNWKEVKAFEVMTKKPRSLKLEDKVSECIKVLARKRFRHLPIVDDAGVPVQMVSIKDLLAFIIKFFPSSTVDYGTLTDWDLLQVEDYDENFSFFSNNSEKFSGNIFKTAIKRILDEPPLSIDINQSIHKMIESMQQKKVGTILVTEYTTELKGIITERDFLFKILKDFDSNDSNRLKTIAEYMTPNPHCLLHKHYLAYAINNMFKYKYRNIIIVDEDKVPLGVVGLLDIFTYIEGYMDL